MSNNDNQHLWRSFERLGEMIGDGLHHEEPWISKEYKRLGKILMPDAYKEDRQRKNAIVDHRVSLYLKEKDVKCTCGEPLHQVRSGSWKLSCKSCGARYRIKTKKQ